jgi:two-component system LytT family response regulator
MTVELSMMGPQRVTPSEASTRTGKGIRVVVLDQDREVCAKVRAAIGDEHEFVWVGESQRWTECEALLERFVPELLIAAIGQLSPQFRTSLSSAAFPVLVGLRSENDRFGTADGTYDTLRIPVEQERLCGLLARVRFEIYRRKADDLSALLQRYMAYSAKGDRYLSSLVLDNEGETQEIGVDQVVYIAADGNYVRVHANNVAHEIRETLTGISSRLDPARFVRIHRSFIVNLSHVLDVAGKEATSPFVRLSNGMEVPIGPNYREEFANLISNRDRLTA